MGEPKKSSVDLLVVKPLVEAANTLKGRPERVWQWVAAVLLVTQLVASAITEAVEPAVGPQLPSARSLISADPATTSPLLESLAKDLRSKEPAIGHRAFEQLKQLREPGVVDVLIDYLLSDLNLKGLVAPRNMHALWAAMEIDRDRAISLLVIAESFPPRHLPDMPRRLYAVAAWLALQDVGMEPLVQLLLAGPPDPRVRRGIVSLLEQSLPEERVKALVMAPFQDAPEPYHQWFQTFEPVIRDALMILYYFRPAHVSWLRDHRVPISFLDDASVLREHGNYCCPSLHVEYEPLHGVRAIVLWRTKLFRSLGEPGRRPLHPVEVRRVQVATALVAAATTGQRLTAGRRQTFIPYPLSTLIHETPKRHLPYQATLDARAAADDFVKEYETRFGASVWETGLYPDANTIWVKGVGPVGWTLLLRWLGVLTLLATFVAVMAVTVYRITVSRQRMRALLDYLLLSVLLTVFIVSLLVSRDILTMIVLQQTVALWIMLSAGSVLLVAAFVLVWRVATTGLRGISTPRLR